MKTPGLRLPAAQPASVKATSPYLGPVQPPQDDQLSNPPVPPTVAIPQTDGTSDWPVVARDATRQRSCSTRQHMKHTGKPTDGTSLWARWQGVLLAKKASFKEQRRNLSLHVGSSACPGSTVPQVDGAGDVVTNTPVSGPALPAAVPLPADTITPSRLAIAVQEQAAVHFMNRPQDMDVADSPNHGRIAGIAQSTPVDVATAAAHASAVPNALGKMSALHGTPATRTAAPPPPVLAAVPAPPSTQHIPAPSLTTPLAGNKPPTGRLGRGHVATATTPVPSSDVTPSRATPHRGRSSSKDPLPPSTDKLRKGHIAPEVTPLGSGQKKATELATQQLQTGMKKLEHRGLVALKQTGQVLTGSQASPRTANAETTHSPERRRLTITGDSPVSSQDPTQFAAVKQPHVSQGSQPGLGVQLGATPFQDCHGMGAGHSLSANLMPTWQPDTHAAQNSPEPRMPGGVDHLDSKGWLAASSRALDRQGSVTAESMPLQAGEVRLGREPVTLIQHLIMSAAVPPTEHRLSPALTGSHPAAAAMYIRPRTSETGTSIHPPVDTIDRSHAPAASMPSYIGHPSPQLQPLYTSTTTPAVATLSTPTAGGAATPPGVGPMLPPLPTRLTDFELGDLPLLAAYLREQLHNHHGDDVPHQLIKDPEFLLEQLEEGLRACGREPLLAAPVVTPLVEPPQELQEYFEARNVHCRDSQVLMVAGLLQV